jgi:tRNA(Arg) A34 adenosine deaminase TadA
MNVSEEIMKTLQRLAESVEPVGKARIAAALVYKNTIVAVGKNRNKTHPFQKKYAAHHDAIFLHAETDAIYNGIRIIGLEGVERCSLYVARAKWQNTDKELMIPGLARPCCGCQRAITTHNIRHVFYTLDDEGYDCL